MKMIDIIIVNHNSTRCAVRCLESIERQVDGVSAHIVVVDNASVDQPEIISKRFPNVHLLLMRKNLGYSKAINLALKNCSAPIVVVLNPDTFVMNSLLKNVLQYMDRNRDVAVLGPKIINPDGTVQGSARTFPSFWSYAFGRKSPITRIFPNNSLTRKQFVCFNGDGEQEIDVDWISGACMVIRREAFDTVKGFDNDFFLYWEDTDFCKRIAVSGWKIVYHPKFQVMHTVGVSSSQKPVRSIIHFHHSAFKLFQKHASFAAQFLAPFVAGALALRCLFVIQLNLIVRKTATVRKKRFSKQQRTSTVCGKRVKVLRFISRMNIGGASMHVAGLSQGMDRSRFETVLVFGSLSPNEGDMSYLLNAGQTGMRFYKLSELQREPNPLKDIHGFFKVLSIILRENPDIVDTHLAKAGALARLGTGMLNMLRSKQIKVVHTYHGHIFEGYFSPWISNIYRKIERVLGTLTDAVIALSSKQKSDLVEKFGIVLEEKVQIINLGFEFSQFNTSGSRNGRFKTEIRATKDTVVIGIVGRLVPIKNHLLFLNAARCLEDKQLHLPFLYAIVGDGELRKKLEDYARLIDIDSKVVFCGWEMNISKVYSEIDILALTSINEGTPVSIIEAMAASVPVITSAVGGIADLLGPFDADQPGTSGFQLCERGILCPSDDPMAFANGIQYMVENKIDKNCDKVQRAREYVMSHYTKDRLVRETEALYLKLLGQP